MKSSSINIQTLSSLKAHFSSPKRLLMTLTWKAKPMEGVQDHQAWLRIGERSCNSTCKILLWFQLSKKAHTSSSSWISKNTSLSSVMISTHSRTIWLSMIILRGNYRWGHKLTLVETLRLWVTCSTFNSNLKSNK